MRIKQHFCLVIVYMHMDSNSCACACCVLYADLRVSLHRKNDAYQLGVTVGPAENLSASVRMGANDKIVDEKADERDIGPEPVQVHACMYVFEGFIKCLSMWMRVCTCLSNGCVYVHV
jgi:hypothetical protein